MDIAEKRERLRLYLDAEKAILTGSQSYQIGSRLLTRADLSKIQKQIDDLIAEIALEENVNGRRKRAIFID